MSCCGQPAAAWPNWTACDPRSAAGHDPDHGEGAACGDVQCQPIASENMLDEAYVNVLGVIPGQGYMHGHG